VEIKGFKFSETQDMLIGLDPEKKNFPGPGHYMNFGKCMEKITLGGERPPEYTIPCIKEVV